MTYNIERGFHSKDHVLERERLEAVQEVVKEVNPEVLSLVEAWYGGDNSKGIFMDYKKLFGFPYCCFGPFLEVGHKKEDVGGNCLLSKISMDAKPFSLAYKGAVRGEFELEDRLLMVDVVHPSYSVSDVEKINTLSPLISTRKSPYIVTGDFNTLYPGEEYDWDELTKDLTRFDSKLGEQIIENWKKADLVSWLMRLGLRDAFPVERRESTLPTSYVHSTPRTGVRMDFFFVSENVKVIDAYVLKNRHTEIASDHYPIIGVFEV